MPEVWLFLLAAMTLTLAPGPDNIYVLTRGISQGRKAGLVAGWDLAPVCYFIRCWPFSVLLH